MSENPFGRIADDGTVYAKLPDGGEKAVGQWAAGDPEAGLQYYRRRYLDLIVEADLALKRIKGGQATPEQAVSAAERLRAAVVDPSGIGDLAVLEQKAGSLEEQAKLRREKLAEEKQAAKEASLAKRTEIADKAQQWAGSDRWKAGGQAFRDLLDEWKKLPRFDRKLEQEQWERFSAARTEFDRRRKAFFSDLKEQNAQGAIEKEALVRRAEALADSTDWGTTSRIYRDLMTQWKAAPRAAKEVDDALWQRFRAAQDKFFGARDAKDAEQNASEAANLAKKEALLTRAEALVPPSDHDKARREFRAILNEWDDIGHVPRTKKAGIERRLRAVEKQISKSERDHWRRTDPATRDRASATAASFRDSLAKQEKELEAARASGNTKKAADIEKSMATTRMLLQAAEGALG